MTKYFNDFSAAARYARANPGASVRRSGDVGFDVTLPATHSSKSTLKTGREKERGPLQRAGKGSRQKNRNQNLPDYYSNIDLQNCADQARWEQEQIQANQNRRTANESERKPSQNKGESEYSGYFEDIPHYEHYDPSEDWMSRGYVSKQRNWSKKKREK